MDAQTQQLLDKIKQAGHKLPPVEDWCPKLCGKIDIRIARNGDWYHEGVKFSRAALVSLLSKVLRKEGHDYYLVTPQEKLRIQVDDAPLQVVDADVLELDGQRSIALVTNTDDHFLLDRYHPLWVCSNNQEPRPYVHVRNGLHALITRAVFYRLIEMAMAQGLQKKNCLYLHSEGEAFLLGVYEEAR